MAEVLNEIDHEKILKELENLVQETFTLWDEKRVGFSWRYYFFNHTQRVRALSLTIGKHEGADLRKLECAALLHDITKRYDGNIMTDKDGKRIIDEDGFWRNEVLMPNPNKSNIVTKLYQEHNQANTLHNVSGAFIANMLLREYGFSGDFCQGVASVVLTHLKPSETSAEKMKIFMNNLEGRILYEADTMDSNLGIVAFFRNIGIHTYSMLNRTGRIDLREYIDGIPRWLNMKEDFLPRMQTETGLKMGQERQKRNWDMWEKIEKEKENFQLNEKYGILGLVKYFMNCCEDPNMSEQMEYIEKHWIPQRKQMIQDVEIDKAEAQKSLESAVNFYSLLSKEVRGKI